MIGRMGSFGFALRQEAEAEALTEEIAKSSEIEGETLDREQVCSSVARRLGMDIVAVAQTDRNVDGVVEMMFDATRRFDLPLTVERLFGWHANLFPTGFSGLRWVRVAAWRDDRDGPMQIVAGQMGHERVHYEAPAASRLDEKMARFLDWFNQAQTWIW